MKLYKFRSLSDQCSIKKVEEILLQKRFYLASWKEFNDPMEGYFQYFISNNEPLYNNAINNVLSDKNDLRICSLARRYNHILMWSHYADNHKGIAIEITVDRKKEKELFKVIYSKAIPELAVNRNLTAIDMLCHKIRIWSYENEYRCISKKMHFDIQSITGIFFGVRVKSEVKEQIIKLVGESIPTFDTKIDFERNRIVRAQG